MRMWVENPRCAICHQITDYPDGFQIDHIQALIADGGKGEETPDNVQLLCIDCHTRKSTRERGHRFHGSKTMHFDSSGRVVW